MEAIAVAFVPELEVKTTVNVCLEIQNELNERFPNTPGKKVIVLGLKNESLMPFLCDKFGEKVSCMDMADWNERNRKIQFKTVQGDFTCLPIANSSVDVMVSADTFEEELDLVRALAEIERVLIGGGEAILIISGEYFDEEEKLKLSTALDVVGSRMVVSPAGEGGFRVITFKKK
jgi:SAM-dependent methyltransferase